MGYCEKVVKYTYKGQSVRSYCRENNVSYYSAHTMLKKGLPVEEVFEKLEKKYFKYDETKDLSQIAEECRKKWLTGTIEEKRKIKTDFFKIKATEKSLCKYWEDIVLNQKQMNVKQSEMWKPAKEKPEIEVSNYGRFRRVNKNDIPKYSPIKAYRHQKRCRKNGPTKEVLFVKVDKERMAKKVVANAFVDNPNNWTCVMQIDGNWKNVRADNLKWVSASQYGKMTGHLSKSKPVKVIDKYKNVKEYRSVRQCAKELGVSYQTILDYLNKKVKKPMFNVKWIKVK
jgi:hypothetical protein